MFQFDEVYVKPINFLRPISIFLIGLEHWKRKGIVQVLRKRLEEIGEGRRDCIFGGGQTCKNHIIIILGMGPRKQGFEADAGAG